MRIDLHVGSVDQGRPEGTERASRQREAARSREASQDEARLSLNQAHLRDLESRVMAMPEVRAEHVERVRSAIADGRYQPPAEKVAEAIVAEWLGRP
jgi:flagellar biosynthesis anti-sigma factor FlgM